MANLEVEMELKDILRKLIGAIDPVGETHTDDKRFENLKVQIELMKELHMQIDAVATENKDRPEFSMSRAGKLADEYLDWLGIEP